jgi:hypothetical protein
MQTQTRNHLLQHSVLDVMNVLLLQEQYEHIRGLWELGMLRVTLWRA